MQAETPQNAASAVNHLPAGADMDWSYWVTYPVMAIKFHDRMMFETEPFWPKVWPITSFAVKMIIVEGQDRERGGHFFEDGWRYWQRQSFPNRAYK